MPIAYITKYAFIYLFIYYMAPLLPVIVGTLRGLDLMSKMIGRWTMGIRK